MTFPLDSRIAHLGDVQLAALTDRYYAGERATNLIREFQISCVPSQLHRVLPPKLLEGQKCSACGAPLIQVRRLPPGAAPIGGSVRCSGCLHQEAGGCACSVCTGRRKERLRTEAEQRCAQIEAYCRSRWCYEPRELTANDLQLEEAVALLAVVRCGGWMSDVTVGAVADSTTPFAPVGALGGALLSSLSAAGVIAPEMDSPFEAFSVHDGQCTISPLLARWRILAESPTLLVRQIERLAGTGEWPDSWNDAVSALQLSLALAECREFADFNLRERGFPETTDVASEALFRNLLGDFSVAQCFRIIWAGAQATADFMARKHVTRRHATNFFIGACQRWADRMRVEGWRVSRGFRNSTRPRSQLSHVLYDVLLGIGEHGFTEPLVELPTCKSRQRLSDA